RGGGGHRERARPRDARAEHPYPAVRGGPAMRRTLHEYSASVVGTNTVIHPEEGSVVLDEAWSPYIGGELVVPSSPELLDLLDPRAGARVRIQFSSRFGEPVPVAAVSADFGGDLAALNAAWSGRQLRS